MMGDLNEFSKRMGVLGSNVVANAKRATKQMAVNIDSALVLVTPVDTGRARSNWQVSIGSPITAVIDAYSVGKNKSTEGENNRAAIAQCKQAIAGYDDGETIFISNNLPYIARLNDGYSAQAAVGFVQTAILNGIQMAKNVTLLTTPDNSPVEPQNG